jgi:ribosomal protein L37AE/L43A
MTEFFDRYGTEDKCHKALEAARWPRGFACPACGGAARSVFDRAGMGYWQCAACPHQTSLISGTIFQGTKLALRVWFQAMRLLTQSKNNVSALELRRQLGVNYHSAWLLKPKIMEAMRLAVDDRELHGRVEIDDAYLGGEHSGGKPGRGSENKVPFVAAVQTTSTGKPIVACLRAQPHTLEEVGVFSAAHIATTATVVSDVLWCFRATTLVGAAHQRIVTGGGRASVDKPEFKAIKTLLGNLKTAITGT